MATLIYFTRMFSFFTLVTPLTGEIPWDSLIARSSDLPMCQIDTHSDLPLLTIFFVPFSSYQLSTAEHFRLLPLWSAKHCRQCRLSIIHRLLRKQQK